jgi:hypothetical protein
VSVDKVVSAVDADVAGVADAPAVLLAFDVEAAALPGEG